MENRVYTITMSLLCTTVLFMFITGCTVHPYTCDSMKGGVRLLNTWQSSTDCSAPYTEYGYFYTGTGTIVNNNRFPVDLVQHRGRYRNSGIIVTFRMEAGESRSTYFTGGDSFRITKIDGTPVGVVHANIIKG